MTSLPHGAITLAAIILLITLGYIGQAWLRPFKKCRRCRGYGRIPTRSGRGMPKRCRKCDGTGLRPRAFRRPARAARRTWNDAR